MEERYMSRTEAERRIRDLLVEIGRISKEYGTKDYMTLTIRTEDGYISFNNSYWDNPDPGERGEDCDRPLNYCEFNIEF